MLIAFFCFTALLAAEWHLAGPIRAIALILPILVAGLALAESRYGNKATGVFREWISPALLFIAYAEINWFQRPLDLGFEHRLIAWDRVVLESWHLRRTIDSLGPILPDALEFCYLMVYAIPALALATLYRCHHRDRVERFLFTFLLGTLATYALLPFFPSESPRLAFTGQDLPAFAGVLRQLNLWLLDHYDIHTSVFPSGHVTAAFSAAWAMLLALPEKRHLGLLFLLDAIVIATATIYGRYHYVADGVVGLLISGTAAAISMALLAPEREPELCPESSLAG